MPTCRSKSSGVVDPISFNSGDDVEAGTAVQLRADDDRPSCSRCRRPRTLNQITFERDQKQFKLQAVSQATLDADDANLKTPRRRWRSNRRSWTRKPSKRRSPDISASAQVDLGQYLSAGTAIVTLQALDPIFVDFFVPQQSLDQLKLGQKVAVKIDAYPDPAFPGEISAINPESRSRPRVTSRCARP